MIFYEMRWMSDRWMMDHDGGTLFIIIKVIGSLSSNIPPISFQNPYVALHDLPVAIIGPSCRSRQRGRKLNFGLTGWWREVIT